MLNAPSALSIAIEMDHRDLRLVLQTFFDEDYGFAFTVKRLHRYLRSAFAKKSRMNKMDMVNMTYFIDVFGKVIAAAEALANEPGCRENGAVITPAAENDLLNPAFYCSKNGLDANAWKSLPRHLGRAEYLDPYRALEKCFMHKSSTKWIAFLTDIFYSAAKDDDGIGENTCEVDLYCSYRYLFKLVEACHLINVREPKAGG